MYEDATIYQLKANADYVVEMLLGGFGEAAFKPCGKYEELSYGFVPVKKGDYLITRKKQALFRVKLEKKILSPAVLRKHVVEAVEDHKDLTGERMSKQQVESLKQEVRTGLLPRAPTITTVVEAYIDTERGCLVVNNPDKDANKVLIQLFMQTLGSSSRAITLDTVAA
ncbi:recombination-associated protein RdgC [Spartinivicinus poritis]|uniref:Recombination-associated protein RdgC n=1 Tax=Spartinivicinus poritis TaxID=2994640 RepID=A0ABT5UFQ8_9GAMM|nr:recombination-associated protein RdgC [Spartinivicinus sp. A2-2]MDE1464821.1 recombination-associated protein RdgC [Spartinivicinus sp. A2-2]